MYKIILLLALFLVSCGFRPVYNDHNAIKLAQIKINDITKKNKKHYKVARVLFESLEDELEHFTYHEKTEKKYNLDINIDIDKNSAIIQHNNQTTRNNITIKINYKIYNINNPQKKINHKLTFQNSYEVAESPYSNMIAAENSSIKLVKLIAKSLKLHIINQLNNQIFNT